MANTHLSFFSLLPFIFIETLTKICYEKQKSLANVSSFINLYLFIYLFISCANLIHYVMLYLLWLFWLLLLLLSAYLIYFSSFSLSSSSSLSSSPQLFFSFGGRLSPFFINFIFTICFVCFCFKYFSRRLMWLWIGLKISNAHETLA